MQYGALWLPSGAVWMQYGAVWLPSGAVWLQYGLGIPPLRFLGLWYLTYGTEYQHRILAG